MWVWVNSGSWWWTGRPGVLRFMGSQRVRHDWVTELIWSDLIALFIIDWLFFISSRSFLNISCIFSILVSSLFICNSILFSRFWIIFTIIILNSFSGRLPIPSSFVWFGRHYHAPLPAEYLSSSSFCLDCFVWGGVSVYWKFVFPLYCGGSSLLWKFLPVGGFVWVACQGFLVREACVSVLVGGAGSPLSGVQLSLQ